MKITEKERSLLLSSWPYKTGIFLVSRIVNKYSIYRSCTIIKDFSFLYQK